MLKAFLLFFLFLSELSFAQSKVEVEIRKVLSDQSIAWNDGNIEKFMEGYWKSDSLMFIGKTSVTRGWQQTLDNYKKNYPNATAMGKLSFDIIHVKKLSGKYFHVVGKWMLARSIGDLSGHFTLLFRKIGGHWVIISDHSS